MPLTLPSPHRVGRGIIKFVFLLWWVIVFGAAAVAQAEVWVCTKADGTEVYSDRNLGGQCRLMEDLPPLLRSPVSPFTQPEESKPEAAKPAPQEAEQVPTPGRGRRIDPPSDAVISIRDVTATPNFNSLLGVAVYQATMLLENGDSTWTAERVCINVRFRDFNFIFLDVQQVGCMDGLKPLDTRSFTVTYTGLIPPRLFPIRAEAKVDYVKWVK